MIDESLSIPSCSIQHWVLTSHSSFIPPCVTSLPAEKFFQSDSSPGNSPTSSINSLAFDSAFILKIADTPNQIAYCFIILWMKPIARGPAYSSSINRYKNVAFKISSRPLTSEGDFSGALSKPHAFALNSWTSVREGEEICLSEFAAVKIISSWPLARVRKIWTLWHPNLTHSCRMPELWFAREKRFAIQNSLHFQSSQAGHWQAREIPALCHPNLIH